MRTENLEELRKAPIGVFDSGMGGISVLRELVRVMPHEDFIYFGDSANAPYGTKPTEVIRELTIRHVENLMAQGAKGIVVACNTATSAAVAVLRKIYPELPLVGIEPAIKPAAVEKPGARIVVMATPMTIRQEKFQKLMARYEDQIRIVPLPCPGLMEFVERGDLEGEDLRTYLQELLGTVSAEPIDGIVLGCTHYPLLRGVIGREMGEEVKLVNPAYETAKSLKELLREKNLLASASAKAEHHYYVSDGVDKFISFANSVLPCRVEKTTVIDIEAY